MTPQIPCEAQSEAAVESVEHRDHAPCTQSDVLAVGRGHWRARRTLVMLLNALGIGRGFAAEIMRRGFAPHASDAGLSLKGHTVGALAYGGVSLVRANLDFVERAVIVAAAVVLAVADGAADVLVCKFSTHLRKPTFHYRRRGSGSIGGGNSPFAVRVFSAETRRFIRRFFVKTFLRSRRRGRIRKKIWQPRYCINPRRCANYSNIAQRIIKNVIRVCNIFFKKHLTFW